MNLTDEQKAIVAAARKGETVKVEAMAGTGKTSSLQAVADELGPGGLYLAFNKTMKSQAERRFSIECRTPHSLAFAGMRMWENQDRIVGGLRPKDVAACLGIDRNEAVPVGARVAAAVARFCGTLDPEPSPAHVERAGSAGPERIARLAADYWRLAWSPGSDAPITHDMYLKQFLLSGRRLPRNPKYLLFDEAQDADPIMLEMARLLGVQVVYVGDPHQRLYAFRGAVDAMGAISAPSLPLTRSWRFGETVAEAANRILRHKIATPRFQLRGDPSKRSRVVAGVLAEPHAVLCRTRAGLFAEAAGCSKPLHVVGGFDEAAELILAANELWAGRGPVRHASLESFASWDDLIRYQKAVRDPELRVVVKAVDTYGPDLPAIVDGIRKRLVTTDEAYLCVMTAHASKGLEFPLVRLAEDFKPIEPTLRMTDPTQHDDELNVIYVGATRASQMLVANSVVQDLVLAA